MKKAVLTLIAAAILLGGLSTASASPLTAAADVDVTDDARQLVVERSREEPSPALSIIDRTIKPAAEGVRQFLIEQVGIDIGPICACVPNPPPPPKLPDPVETAVGIHSVARAFVWHHVGIDIGPICACLPNPPPPPKVPDPNQDPGAPEVGITGLVKGALSAADEALATHGGSRTVQAGPITVTQRGTQVGIDIGPICACVPNPPPPPKLPAPVHTDR